MRYLLCLLVLCGTSCAGIRQLPPMANYNHHIGERVETSPGSYTLPNGLLRKNQQGLWELYVSGDPLERGLANGVLTEELLHRQEAAFVSQVQKMVPSRFRQWLLRRFLDRFNRQLTDHIPPAYQAEIYGLSRSAADTFNFIAPPYPRLLSFHAAHDIGHALQDLALVGCTSFAAWDGHTADGKLLIGRNFDFYAGDAFAEEKVVAFIDPDQGYKHAMVTWPGMVGAVSGMNVKGLTVTINAGKSAIPHQAKTPISLLTREILQYAGDIDEAIHIARQREVFVSESIMVGSAADGKAVLIEVSPHKLGVYAVPNSSDVLVCANHFQSEPYRSDKRNLRQLEESHSKYRFDRMNELIAQTPKLTPADGAAMLRNKEGIGGVALGYGNEKAINQLLAHHAVIFQPEDRRMWVAAAPYQLGEFVAYDLDEVFARLASMDTDVPLATDSLNISADPFALSADFRHYEEFRVQMRNLEAAIATEEEVPDTELRNFQQLNPMFWKTDFLIGEYYRGQHRKADALRHYQLAASREVTTKADSLLIQKRIKKCK
ncbi:C45 family peptidase [Parapedobacter sp. 10938]|uniref:C45 family peptidase n=1 Tax=Parapedobacter flavus TaxID=3110225 RepID=UPI002DBF135E|nr:C45 family peptidase [Parapedobacter sp. 10938]MEC3879317.1 C45 family peptidase [Parapedobacter sp. 10938]